ncbi:hypothetical protein [Amycolatopsis regifaucium]|uniref:Uncharacterized protein n=1 Tax=Amycolatopsis regifaucium TaxID=546365 RepID=A0A154MAG8_9PSEU|nr:hypothetical protein [Amycolatopsis regifaucium]KZB81648.1 hypothetical protein AVL48_06540 [Amycolatopsis regifaucium]OKA06288.1 hypothetical protein ATP06_0224480 [Amycolatopsis regifaucium]SFG66442.1 hypothetical protein SAMN04489731_10172 [Amycolatopsis regifaucium]
MRNIDGGFLAAPDQAALERRERDIRKGKLALALTVVGGFVTLIAGYQVFVDFSPGALVVTMIALAVAVGGGMLTKQLNRTVRFRVHKPNAGLVAAAKLSGILVVFFALAALLGSIDAPGPLRVILIAGVCGVLAYVRSLHDQQWVLFELDAVGVRVERTVVPWRDVTRLTIDPVGPGMTRLGAVPVNAEPLYVAVQDSELDSRLLTEAVARFAPRGVLLTGVHNPAS